MQLTWTESNGKLNLNAKKNLYQLVLNSNHSKLKNSTIDKNLNPIKNTRKRENWDKIQEKEIISLNEWLSFCSKRSKSSMRSSNCSFTKYLNE